MYVNQHIVSGNIGQDAVLRNAGDTQVASFSIANTSPFGKKQTTWYNVALFGRQAETLVSMLTKGTRVLVIGETSQSEYTNKNGETKQSLDIRASSVQLVDRRGASNSNEAEEDVDSSVDDLF